MEVIASTSSMKKWSQTDIYLQYIKCAEYGWFVNGEMKLTEKKKKKRKKKTQQSTRNFFFYSKIALQQLVMW